MTYWKSWQGYSEWEKTRALMKDDFKLDAGLFQTETADQLIDMMRQGNPWKEIQLLDSVFSENKGVLLYEGIDSVTNSKIRIAEVITVKDGKVATCISSISTLVGDTT